MTEVTVSRAVRANFVVLLLHCGCCGGTIRAASVEALSLRLICWSDVCSLWQAQRRQACFGLAPAYSPGCGQNTLGGRQSAPYGARRPSELRARPPAHLPSRKAGPKAHNATVSSQSQPALPAPAACAPVTAWMRPQTAPSVSFSTLETGAETRTAKDCSNSHGCTASCCKAASGGQSQSKRCHLTPA